ncbi:crossover junction endodeoxyribonuclease RuvC [Canibacter sp. lx-72]|uniref:crossover junction endodeoxyribonuclease RuvC n=1 Tax=Canibacter zhuwentaonis TaxID=2837491 RepID=UPI001BDC696F|nr:crossover junction endodeoxyribonuclease RuvC [Canibacter zhuwentaonis]MBT1018466.1 crossover junction endodeoxyribonuclease RuvC [Canibacter zhuwentaonis]
MRVVLGIDPGLTRCGVGLIEVKSARRLEFLHVEVLRSAVEDPLEQRLLQLGSAIERLLDGLEKPADIAIERVFAQENLPSVMGVAQISGIVLYAAAKRGIPVKMYTPNEVKLQVTGYGAAEKSQIIAMVTKILGLQTPPKPADAADALALAITHAWFLARGGGSQSAAAGINQNLRVTPKPASALTAAQRAWREAEQKTGRRRGGIRR